MDYLSGAGDRRFLLVNLPSSRPKSAIVSRLSREPEFPGFLASIGYNTVDQESIIAAICEISEITSRAELDRDPEAMARFEERIGMPYASYRLRLTAGGAR
ncbi:hypothetical protein [Herbaspirillum sp. ST 5-3]|uniref:hypothetical protein n=1 Tax=Oxalobacteraceae TaxID=75682 RepID=UPI0010A57E36|nr:hypothetical protein [Herbaspirillum sp. ST 5-3]